MYSSVYVPGKGLFAVKLFIQSAGTDGVHDKFPRRFHCRGISASRGWQREARCSFTRCARRIAFPATLYPFHINDSGIRRLSLRSKQRQSKKFFSPSCRRNCAWNISPQKRFATRFMRRIHKVQMWSSQAVIYAIIPRIV